MKSLSQKELNDILEQHKLWLGDNTKGKRAQLRDLDMRELKFPFADLRKVQMFRCILDDLRDTICTNVRFMFSILKSVKFNTDLKGAKFAGAW